MGTADEALLDPGRTLLGPNVESSVERVLHGTRKGLFKGFSYGDSR